jgi:hypothetical protein
MQLMAHDEPKNEPGKCRTCHAQKSATFRDIRDIWGAPFLARSRKLANSLVSLCPFPWPIWPMPKKTRQTAPFIALLLNCWQARLSRQSRARREILPRPPRRRLNSRRSARARVRDLEGTRERLVVLVGIRRLRHRLRTPFIKSAHPVRNVVPVGITSFVALESSVIFLSHT